MAREDNRRDTAGIGPDPSLAGRLTRLSSMRGFDIAHGEPDIRGWDVRTLSGAEIGEVDDLLVDPHRGEVVLIDIDMKGSDQHVNVPIRGVQIDRTRRCVIVDSGDLRNARESGLGLEDRDLAQERTDGEQRLQASEDAAEEIVVERRPVIEEVVIRRRVVDQDDSGDRV